MRDPLNQFADRLVRNSSGITGEIAEFLNGLIDKGMAIERLYGILDARRNVVVGRLQPSDNIAQPI